MLDYTPSNDTIEINLSRGMKTIIDEIDADLINYKWSARVYTLNTIYAIRDSKKKRQYMHRVILERIIGRVLEQNEYCDHIDKNGLNNRRENLRLATKTENQRNQRKPKSNTSGYKGVSWFKLANKWRAYIVVDYKQIYLGLFNNIEDAAQAYREAAIKYHGEFASLE